MQIQDVVNLDKKANTGSIYILNIAVAEDGT